MPTSGSSEAALSVGNEDSESDGLDEATTQDNEQTTPVKTTVISSSSITVCTVELFPCLFQAFTSFEV